jgi:hypothetical protein
MSCRAESVVRSICHPPSRKRPSTRRARGNEITGPPTHPDGSSGSPNASVKCENRRTGSVPGLRIRDTLVRVENIFRGCRLGFFLDFFKSFPSHKKKTDLRSHVRNGNCKKLSQSRKEETARPETVPRKKKTKRNGSVIRTRTEQDKIPNGLSNPNPKRRPVCVCFVCAVCAATGEPLPVQPAA